MQADLMKFHRPRPRHSSLAAGAAHGWRGKLPGPAHNWRGMALGWRGKLPAGEVHICRGMVRGLRPTKEGHNCRGMAHGWRGKLSAGEVRNCRGMRGKLPAGEVHNCQGKQPRAARKRGGKLPMVARNLVHELKGGGGGACQHALWRE